MYSIRSKTQAKLDYLQNNTKTKTRNTLHTKVRIAKITSFISQKNL